MPILNIYLLRDQIKRADDAIARQGKHYPIEDGLICTLPQNHPKVLSGQTYLQITRFPITRLMNKLKLGFKRKSSKTSPGFVGKSAKS